MKLFKAMATVAGMTGLSRIAGFIRDILTANVLGAGPIADAFFVALKLPNFFRRVTAEGAFSVSFVPRYGEALEKEGPTAAYLFASRTFTIMFLVLSVFTGVMMLFMPWVIYLIAPGFHDDPIRYDYSVAFSMITFPYLVMISLTSLLGGVLNTHDRFAPFAFSPVLFNLTLIGSLYCTGYVENAGYALSYGIFAAGFVQLVFMYVVARRNGIHIRLVKPELSDSIRDVFRRMGPGVIGAGVLQINIFADLMIASFMQEGSVSYLYYADRLNQLPLGTIGIAVGTALLPMLTKALASGRVEEGKHLFNRALEVCLLLGLPAGAALFVIPHFLVEALFEHGKFSAQDTYYTGYVLMGYALGLPAYIAVKVISSVFWAEGDTKTPVKVAIMCAVTNILLSLVLIQFMGIMGLTLATSFAGWLQYVLLNRLLPKKMGYDDRLKEVFPKIIASVLIMSALLYVFALYASAFSDQAKLGEALEMLVVVAVVGVGGSTYIASIFMLKVVKLSDFKQYFRRKPISTGE